MLRRIKLSRTDWEQLWIRDISTEKSTMLRVVVTIYLNLLWTCSSWLGDELNGVGEGPGEAQFSVLALNREQGQGLGMEERLEFPGLKQTYMYKYK
jgi:hypothetical protein